MYRRTGKHSNICIRFWGKQIHQTWARMPKKISQERTYLEVLGYYGVMHATAPTTHVEGLTDAMPPAPHRSCAPLHGNSWKVLTCLTITVRACIKHGQRCTLVHQMPKQQGRSSPFDDKRRVPVAIERFSLSCRKMHGYSINRCWCPEDKKQGPCLLFEPAEI
jgi:hypothetical protein